MERRLRYRALAPVAAALAVARLVLAVPVGYLSVLTAAAWLATLTDRSARRVGPMNRRFAVLVPAHDEEPVIGETLEALAALEYPDGGFQVHVLADHCTDRTASIARGAGAEVHEFDGDVRGKGPALGTIIEALAGDVSSARTVDAFVIVDADTIVDRGFLRAVDVAMADGADAVQGQYRVRDPGSSTGAGLRAAALTLRHHLRPLGRTTLGASSGLFGNGMAFTRQALDGRAWTNHLTEDIELQMELLLDGTLVAYAPRAVVEAEMPATLDGARTQNERWERGRLDLARRYVPLLVRAAIRRRGRQRRAAVDAALDHAVPPLSVLVAGVGLVTIAGAAVAAVRGKGVSSAHLVLPGAMVVHVLSGLVLGRAPASVYASLLHAPAMVVWKVRLWVRMLVRGADVDWVRTAREAAS